MEITEADKKVVKQLLGLVDSAFDANEKTLGNAEPIEAFGLKVPVGAKVVFYGSSRPSPYRARRAARNATIEIGIVGHFVMSLRVQKDEVTVTKRAARLTDIQDRR